jgi:hypothetical protein
VDATSEKCREASALGADGVVVQLPIIGGLNQPPRLREALWLRKIFLIAQPPLLVQEGSRGLKPSMYANLASSNSVTPAQNKSHARMAVEIGSRTKIN